MLALGCDVCSWCLPLVGWCGSRVGWTLCVSVFRPSGEKLQSFKHSSAQGQFAYPGGVAVDGEGNIRLEEPLKCFRLMGNITAVGTDGSRPLQFHFPIGIAFNASIIARSTLQVLNFDLTFSST